MLSKRVFPVFADGAFIFQQISVIFYPLANEVAKGYNNATDLPSVRPFVTSL
jgi:hypothetical protein